MLTRRLVWVAVEGREMHGVFIAFAAHGFLYPVRLTGRRGGRWVRGLLRKAFSESMQRGYHFWVTQTEKTPVGRKLEQLALRRGARHDGNGYIGGQISSLFDVAKTAEVERVAC